MRRKVDGCYSRHKSKSKLKPKPKSQTNKIITKERNIERRIKYNAEYKICDNACTLIPFNDCANKYEIRKRYDNMHEKSKKKIRKRICDPSNCTKSKQMQLWQRKTKSTYGYKLYYWKDLIVQLDFDLKGSLCARKTNDSRIPFNVRRYLECRRMSDSDTLEMIALIKRIFRRYDICFDVQQIIINNLEFIKSVSIERYRYVMKNGDI